MPEKLKAELRKQLETGFQDWNQEEYYRFIRGLRKCEIGDFEGIAVEVQTKTPEEVSNYLTVFLQRFRELRERDIVIAKFEQKTFDQKNLETIRNFDRNRARNGGYMCMVQTNHYFSTQTYLELMAKAQD